MSLKKPKKSIYKYALLLGIKESYLLGRNILGLKEHPFKTLREIVEEHDYSQAFLVFGLPFNLLVFGLLGIFLLRVLVGKSGKWGWLALSGLGLLTFLVVGIFFHIFYWGLKVYKWRKNEKPFS